MRNEFKICILVLALLTGSCDKKNDGVIQPVDPEKLPQVILFDDEEAGETEDSDEAEFTLTLLDRIDPSGEELGGTVVPLASGVTVSFEISDIEGFDRVGDYILEAEASYEIDDCNDEDVPVTFDPATGKGTVVFPAGAEEVEVTFVLNEDLFDDDIVNDDDRGFKVRLTGVTGGSEPVVANTDLEFEYKVLDDDVIFGEWELEDDLDGFKALFGFLDDDIPGLAAAEIKGIRFEFGLNELEIEIELEEEEEDDCGEWDNKTIEIEAEYDDLTDDKKEGEIRFIVEVEDEEGFVEEVEYSGTFVIKGEIMEITLEVDGTQRTLKLKRD
ncbi:MAG: hypothetical protein LRY55_03035 [Leadbetterella sp.]|nr:hypothetical protein [Leadbetterella sp.]